MNTLIDRNIEIGFYEQNTWTIYNLQFITSSTTLNYRKYVFSYAYMSVCVPLVIGTMTTCIGATGGGRTRPLYGINRKRRKERREDKSKYEFKRKYIGN
jgi:hypothetical protein